MASVPNMFQERLAVWVVVSGIAISGLCAITAIVAVGFQSTTGMVQVAQAARDILTILLPVIGTWIGTVLAFYFGKENFEAGARETRLTLGQRLDSKAMDAAIPVDKIKSIDVADDAAAKALPLDKIDTHLKTIGFARTPIFTTSKVPLYVVHRQPLDSFVAQHAKANKPLTGLTLKDLLDSTEGAVVKESFVTVPESATLAEAKAAMEAVKSRQDVFITRTGKADSPVVAWLTNNEIQRASAG